MNTKIFRLNWIALAIYAATAHANNAGGLPQCNTDLTVCQTTNTQLQNSLTTCQTTNTQLQGSLNTCQTSLGICQTSLSSCQTASTQLQSSLNSCQTSLGTCQASNTQLQQQAQTDQSTIATLQQQLQAAQAQIASLQSSCTGGGSTTPPSPIASMPSGLTEYIEFSLLPSSVASDRFQSSKWDLTGSYSNVVAGSNMTWDATLKAWRAPGGVGDWFVCSAFDAIDTGWRPSNGPKTACMWKRFYEIPSGQMGLDGFQDAPGTNGKYFYYGTYGGRCAAGTYEWLFASGSNGATGIGCGTTPKKDEWVFYCMASNGDQGTTSLYTAVAGDTNPVLRRDLFNGWDSGFITNATGMRYGCLDTNQHGSRAHYGSMIHFNSKLTADQVNQVYQATKVYYPGHGGTR